MGMLAFSSFFHLMARGITVGFFSSVSLSHCSDESSLLTKELQSVTPHKEKESVSVSEGNHKKLSQKNKFITIGSTKKHVASIQGTPKSIRNYRYFEVWTFEDGSTLTFEENLVTEWNNYGRLKVKIAEEPAPTLEIRRQKTTADKTIPSSHSAVAENGSYRGEISNRTGRGKNTYVPGYYRKNGTYVRGHYRS